jgi:hypothetical protein
MPVTYECDDCGASFSDQRMWNRHITICDAVTNDSTTYGQQMLDSIANSEALQALQQVAHSESDVLKDHANTDLHDDVNIQVLQYSKSHIV